MAEGSGRVVLGVSHSISGLCALRRAVAEARRRDGRLYAVRVWSLPAARGFAAPEVWCRNLADIAAEEIRAAFEMAMGGLPADVEFRLVTLEGLVAPTLVGYSGREEDLLVVGVGRRPWYRRPASAQVARYCVRNARCPVLAVPPPELAAVASTRALARAVEREAARLADAGFADRGGGSADAGR
jgi:nucleotide-binding universal stress UspA family protein